MHTESPVRATLSAISPLFVVSDLQRALMFYRERLGFELTDHDGYLLFFGRPA
jgi:catechol 2,3-dioxygenase-like lactoylglutathione lyase family enzyme